MKKVLITGSAGLVGTALAQAFRVAGFEVVGLDLRGHGEEYGDVLDEQRVRAAMQGVDLVIHCAAVSRVISGEQDRWRCFNTNVKGTFNVFEVARVLHVPVLYVSSREVYGNPASLPVTEDFPIQPINTYGITKQIGENLVNSLQLEGYRVAIVRLSNVYGSVYDYEDRVVPAFVSSAILGRPLRVDGPEHTFDFTHINDVVSGLMAIANLLMSDAPVPPTVHLLTGRPTTLQQLAELAIHTTRSNSPIVHAEPRNYDVAKFYGDPARAKAVLGWSTQISIEEGVKRLINDFRRSFNQLRKGPGR